MTRLTAGYGINVSADTGEVTVSADLGTVETFITVDESVSTGSPSVFASFTGTPGKTYLATFQCCLENTGSEPATASAWLTDAVSPGSNASGSQTIQAGGWASISAAVSWSCTDAGDVLYLYTIANASGVVAKAQNNDGAPQATGIIALEVN